MVAVEASALGLDAGIQVAIEASISGCRSSEYAFP